MKYYRRLITVEGRFPCKEGIIYAETYQEDGFKNVAACVRAYPEHWKEVSEYEYLLQLAKKKYPVGTTIRSIYGDIYTIGETDEILNGKSNTTSKHIFVYYKDGDKMIYDDSDKKWAEIIKEQEFILPDKWCIKDNNTTSKWASEIFNCLDIQNSNKYLHINQLEFPKGNCYNFLKEIRYDYTEITFEQFEKYILNKETMEKKIIGYKLTKPEYKSLVMKALDLNSAYEPNIIIAGMMSYYVPKIKQLGIMDWFEPAYEVVKPEVTIKGFDAQIGDVEVKFGCQTYSKKFVIELAKCLKDNSFLFVSAGKDYSNEISKLAEYYERK